MLEGSRSGAATEALSMSRWTLALLPFREKAKKRGAARGSSLPGAPGTAINTIARFLVRDRRAELSYAEIVLGARLKQCNGKMAVWKLYDMDLLTRSGPHGSMRYRRAGALREMWARAQAERRAKSR